MTQPESHFRPTLLQSLSRWLYTGALTVALPLVFIHLLIRGALTHGQQRFERLGLVARPPKPGGYLFHCVSVGEVVAASCLIKRIMEREPEVVITVTTTTATGSARVKAIFGDSVHHFYLPYDLPVCMSAMLRRVKPRAVLITEVELWPNFIHTCWRRSIPVMVINARMTDRSAVRYGKIRGLFNPMLHKVAHVCAQGERDYINYKALGMPDDRLTLTNNIKFDQAVGNVTNAGRFLNLHKGTRPVLVAGSTHDPEEQLLLEVLPALQQHSPNALLIIVPRHPERFDTVARLLDQAGVSYCRSSVTEHIDDNCEVVLVDEMGKLHQAYEVATFAFVGGSVAPRGGHNALEPASASVPVIMGPHTYNNPVICEYLQHTGALTIIEDAAQMARVCTAWLNDPEQARQAGQAGRQVLQSNRGALDATLSCFDAVMQGRR
ncbi:3-deoxy-D-manno-octulosonic acid transferase [Alteromonas sp. ASW11-19]|uniref:3-deoxy-D-manno-octulosonic acid transferase n=1 Tax=Alteromonas salexigens TaxID=2982530 RepID=A0ABT2VJG7_9ALTE|nr:3-deoxy-D-manno-octulosonic acid transferase [Alteromonas salexigens]MCU7553368.1 3-deoxy-D-manno-octulosonic acid transferase [Alteromonas salexigens]